MHNGKETGEDKIRSVIDKGLENAKEVIEEQTAKLKEKIEDVDWAEVPGEVKSYVRRRPLKSLALAVGLGFLVGYIFKSNKKD